MPNWVKGILTIEGENSEQIMKSLLKKDDFDDIEFDFNKIVPMPDDLNIVSGSLTDDCYSVYLSSLPIQEAMKDIELYVNSAMFPEFLRGRQFLKSKEEIDKIVKHSIERLQEPDKLDPTRPVFKTKDDVIAYGKRVSDNLKNYGSKDWYDWCVKNWGTKWNACGTEFDESNPTQIKFDTAWSDVRMLISKLSEKYPNNLFIYNYAMEETGVYTGVASFKDGKVYDEAEYDDQSKEAYEQAFMVWGQHLKQYYRYDEKAGTYKYVEDSDAEM